MLNDLETRKRVAFGSALLLISGIAIWYVWPANTGPDIDPHLSLVCVATGRQFEIDRDRIGTVPAKNPDTGERTLLPCEAKENGQIVLVARYRSLLEQLKEKNEHVDPATLVVNVIQ